MTRSSPLALVLPPSVAPRHASNLRPLAKCAPRDSGDRAARARFVAARHKIGLTQLEAAEYLGVGSSSLADWERGAARIPAWALVEIERRAA